MATSAKLADILSAAKKRSSAISMLADASKTLTWNLHVDMLKKNNASKNYVLSPYSLSTAFGMSLLGTQGETYKEMVGALGLPANATQENLIAAFRVAHDSIQSAVGDTEGVPYRRKGDEAKNDEPSTSVSSSSSNKRHRTPKGPPSLQLNTAIKLYAQQDIGKVREEYLIKLEKAFAYRALEQVDFRRSSAKVCAQINAFVDQATRGKVKNVVKSLNPEETSLLIVNAVYMKAKWAEKFKKDRTIERGEFYVAHEKRLRNDVPMMRKCDYLQYASNKAAQFVWLPYEGRQVQMVIAVPTARDGGLNSLLAEVPAAGGFGVMVKSVQFEHGVIVDLTMPRFKIETSVVLDDIMKRLGMKQAFSKEAANFHGMMEKHPSAMPDEKLLVWIGTALQKAVIEVDEEGTEAAAVTIVHTFSACVQTCAKPPPRIVQVKADKPFMYWIEHVGTGLVLFSGAVVNP